MDTRKHKIGLLGGSFNPIHLGHLSIAQQVLGKLGLDKALLIPAGQPPHKDSARLAPAADRLAMCRLAVRGLSGLDVNDIEIQKETTCYTIETIRALRASLPPGTETWFIIGADTVPELPTWRRIDELARLTHWAIVQRPGARKPNFDALDEILSSESARELREGVVGIDEPVDISSTEIRARLAKGEHVRGLLCGPVEDYIRRKGLYGVRG